MKWHGIKGSNTENNSVIAMHRTSGHDSCREGVGETSFHQDILIKCKRIEIEKRKIPYKEFLSLHNSKKWRAEVAGVTYEMRQTWKKASMMTTKKFKRKRRRLRQQQR